MGVPCRSGRPISLEVAQGRPRRGQRARCEKGDSYRNVRERERPRAIHQPKALVDQGVAIACDCDMTRSSPSSVARYQTLTRPRAPNVIFAARGSTRPRHAAIIEGSPSTPMITMKSSGMCQKIAKPTKRTKPAIQSGGHTAPMIRPRRTADGKHVEEVQERRKIGACEPEAILRYVAHGIAGRSESEAGQRSRQRDVGILLEIVRSGPAVNAPNNGTNAGRRTGKPYARNAK